MPTRLEPRQMEELRKSLSDRARQLREEIRQPLVKSDSEHHQQIADEVHDLEDGSFADLMVDVNVAETDRDLEELRAVEAAMLRIADGSDGTCDQCGRRIEIE